MKRKSNLISAIISGFGKAACLALLSQGLAHAVPVRLVTETTLTSELRDIVVDAGNVYFTGSGPTTSAVFTAPRSGGPASTLYLGSSYQQGGSNNAWGITMIGADIYWADSQAGAATDSAILKGPKTGGPIVRIYSGLAIGQPIVDVWGLEAFGGLLVSADAVQGRVHRLNSDGSSLTQVGPNRYGGFFAGARQNYIALCDDTVFIAESAVPTAATLPPYHPRIQSHSASDTSGDFVTMLIGAPLAGDGPRGIACGDGKIFFTQGDTIYSMPQGGGALEAITNPMFRALSGIDFEDNALYVLDSSEDVKRVWEVSLGRIPEPGSLALLGIGVAALALRRRTSSRRPPSTDAVIAESDRAPR